MQHDSLLDESLAALSPDSINKKRRNQGSRLSNQTKNTTATSNAKQVSNGTKLIKVQEENKVKGD